MKLSAFLDRLDEAGAGPSRLVTHIRSGTPFITISARREYRTVEENNIKDQSLREDLRNFPVSIIPVRGGWMEKMRKIMSFQFMKLPISLCQTRILV